MIAREGSKDPSLFFVAVEKIYCRRYAIIKYATINLYLHICHSHAMCVCQMLLSDTHTPELLMNFLDDTVGKPDFSFAIKNLKTPLQNELGFDDKAMSWFEGRIDALLKFALTLGRPALFAIRNDDKAYFFLMPLDNKFSPKLIEADLPNRDYFDSEIGIILENQVVASKTMEILRDYDAVADLTLVRLLTGIYSLEDAMNEPDSTDSIAYFK